jgi:hypothetical protein|tara:strand:+ start:472 stop:615 length:144 start_codon:yes stop_codon:yes gene_type:complete
VTPEQKKIAQEAKTSGNKEFVAGQFDAAAKVRLRLSWHPTLFPDCPE